MSEPAFDMEAVPPDLVAVLRGLGREMEHAAELLRRYERAVLDHAPAGTRPRAGDLQLVDLVIQILEDVGPFSVALANLVPPGTAVPAALIDEMRLDQLRQHLGGGAVRRTPHSGGEIDVF